MLEILDRSAAVPPGAPAGAYRLDYRSAVDGTADWAVVCPGTLPIWVVMIHGHGSHGDQLFTRADIRDAWLPTLLAGGAGIVTPNLRDNAWMSPAAATDLCALLAWLRSSHGAHHFILFSGSMGGTSNLLYAALHPEDVAACVALGAATDLASYHAWCQSHPAGSVQREIGDAIVTAYGATPAAAPELFQRHSTLRQCARLTMPVFFAHGGADALIPVEQARQLAAAMADRPAFEYVEISGGDHDSPAWDRRALAFFDRQLARLSGGQ
ncbi:MAG: alpha/beta fold hydrolase [Lentisphaeria bacterium]